MCLSVVCSGIEWWNNDDPPGTNPKTGMHCPGEQHDDGFGLSAHGQQDADVPDMSPLLHAHHFHGTHVHTCPACPLFAVVKTGPPNTHRVRPGTLQCFICLLVLFLPNSHLNTHFIIQLYCLLSLLLLLSLNPCLHALSAYLLTHPVSPDFTQPHWHVVHSLGHRMTCWHAPTMALPPSICHALRSP